MFPALHLGVAYDAVFDVAKRFLIWVILFGTSIRGCVREYGSSSEGTEKLRSDKRIKMGCFVFLEKRESEGQ